MSRSSTTKSSVRNGRSKLSHILSCKGFNHDIEIHEPHSNNTSGFPNIRRDPSQEKLHHLSRNNSQHTLEHTKIVNDLAESLNHLYIFKKSKAKEDESSRKKMLERRYELSLGTNDFSIKDNSALMTQGLFKLVQKRTERTPTANATATETNFSRARDNTIEFATSPHIAPASTNSSSLLQKLYVKNLGTPAVKNSKTPGGGSPYSRSPAGSESPKKRSKRNGSLCEILNYQLPLNSPPLVYATNQDLDQSQIEHRSRILQKAFISKRQESTSPDDRSGSITPIHQPDSLPPKQELPKRRYRQASGDPFSRLVKYKDNTMPFSLAVNAEARQKMFSEMKRAAHEKVDMNSIIELRDKKIPEAKAKFLKTLTKIEGMKKDDELRSRSQEKNTLYQIYALDKDTQKKVTRRLKKQLSENSRFLNIK